MIDIAILAGGRSSEHRISLRSGRQVVAHIDRERWRPWPVHLGRDGAWHVASQPLAPDQGVDDEFRVTEMHAMRPGAALDVLLDCNVEVVFPVLHGRFGEDGTVQGMCELHDVACVGSGCAASAVAMDKLRTRECLSAHGVPMPPAHVPAQSLAAMDAPLVAAEISDAVGTPCFLKIDWSGSTIGVARCDSSEAIAEFLTAHRGFGRRVLAETMVPGDEITVPVLGNSGAELQPLPLVGIYPVEDDYFTHEAKYDPSKCEEVVPPRGLDDERMAELQELGVRCHEALQCDGLSRTDVILGPNGPVVLEVNTIPGMSQASLFPKAAAAAGITFARLIDRLLELALVCAERSRA